MRYFNTDGPVRPDKHYTVPPLARLDLDDIASLIRREEYWVLRAPRHKIYRREAEQDGFPITIWGM